MLHIRKNMSNNQWLGHPFKQETYYDTPDVHSRRTLLFQNKLMALKYSYPKNLESRLQIWLAEENLPL